jgi:putative membrane protein
MSGEDQPRKPRVFQVDDARLEASGPELPDAAADMAVEDQQSSTAAAVIAGAAASQKRRGIRWGSIFFAALSGLVSIAVTIWIANFVSDLFARGGWLGWTALALALIAAFAALMMAVREIVGFFRLGRVAALRLQAEAALADADGKRTLAVSRGIEQLLSGREELRWGARRLADHRGAVLSPREVLILTERELLTPLDRQAKTIIRASVRRVALLTAISPAAIIDVAFVAIQVLTMLRRLATLYGGRPGFLGSLRLARLVLGHLALTGGVALGEDVVQQLIGHGLTARLSARLGEGVVNGAFTGRIGIAAVDMCRPLPFIEAERPRLRDFLADLRILGRRQTAPPPPDQS